MGFNKLLQNKMLLGVLALVVLSSVVILSKTFHNQPGQDAGSLQPISSTGERLVKATGQGLPVMVSNAPQLPTLNDPNRETSQNGSMSNPGQVSVIPNKTDLAIGGEDDSEIQDQLDRDRRQQKQTKDLKNKLEQTNLELEQEKALAEINKLKKENMGSFNEPAIDGQNNLPEIKVDYIGGDVAKKEAILSISGASYQVKEKSNPTDNIQVMSISDSSVTLHFNAPIDLTKTYDYKPE